MTSTLHAVDRRSFIRQAAAAGTFLVGCGDDEGQPSQGSGGAGGATSVGGMGGAGGAPGEMCDDPFAGGELLGVMPFVGENEDNNLPLDTQVGQGWDGRLYTDLSTLQPDQLIVDNDRFYVRTLYPDLLVPPDPWTISVGGLATAATLALPDLLPMVAPMGAHVLECSGNSRGGAFGLMSAAEWSGIPVPAVLDMLDVAPSATRVLISGFDEHSVPSVNNHSTPGASWIFSFEQLAQAFLATEMNGVPLPPNHGAPVRLYVPNWYGCTCIKWVNEISFVDEDEPATSQMKEFASRTHQIGVPDLARDYLPASMDQAAMPVRIEKWNVSGAILYRVVGIMWGGYEVTDALEITYGDGEFAPVNVCPAQSQNQTWTLWSAVWSPTSAGIYPIRLRVNDPAIPQIRLSGGYYLREVEIDQAAG